MPASILPVFKVFVFNVETSVLYNFHNLSAWLKRSHGLIHYIFYTPLHWAIRCRLLDSSSIIRIGIFVTEGIINHNMKFHCVFAAIDVDILCYAWNLIRKPPTVNVYETLKLRINDHFSHSKDILLRTLFLDLKLDDYCTKKKTFVTDKISDDFFAHFGVNVSRIHSGNVVYWKIN